MGIVKFAKENYGDFVKRANPAMNKMTALQTLLSGKDLSKEEVPLIKEFKTVQEFLNLPMGDKKEVVLKKAFATAVTIAKDKGVLPFEVNSSEQIASLVDDGLTRMKVAYQTATGKIDAYQAVDALVDRVAFLINCSLFITVMSAPHSVSGCCFPNSITCLGFSRLFISWYPATHADLVSL